ncbi:hypothetical protein Goarm_017782, partial [Gossypium armourianum]|nr:hypothetical protein [Gossypium armourianum]
MLFLGHLGDIELAAGSLAIAFANITGYSVLSGLALGMEPLCSQAFDPNITRIGQKYLFFALPDLFTQSLFHPIRIYLRAQGITHPFGFGVAGVAASASISNFFVLVSLVVYVWTAEWWWYEIMIVLCGLLVNPKATVASMGILIQTTSLIYVFPSSLSFAVSTRVGNELGANRPYKARLSAVVAVFVSTMTGLSASTFASSMKDKWAMMFTSDSEILRLTSIALPILGLCELGNCPQTVGCGVLRGSARPSTAANVNLGAFYLVGM